MEVDFYIITPKEIDLHKQIDEMMKPIKNFDANSSVKDIANACAKFKEKMDLFNSTLFIDEGFQMVKETLAKEGVYLNSKDINNFANLVKNTPKITSSLMLKQRKTKKIMRF